MPGRNTYEQRKAEVIVETFSATNDPPTRVRQDPEGNWWHISVDGSTYTPIALTDHVVEHPDGRVEVLSDTKMNARFRAPIIPGGGPRA